MSARLDSIADELMALRDGNGKINPASTVEWARNNNNSRLHAQLEWDDTVAGERYRVWQIRCLIAVHIVDPQGQRRFVSLSIDRHEGGYRPLSDVLSSKDLRDIMLADALGELERMQKKYAHLQELDEVWRARDKVQRGRKIAAVKKVTAAAA